jgi:hypothetical protein
MRRKPRKTLFSKPYLIQKLGWKPDVVLVEELDLSPRKRKKRLRK